MTRISTDLGSVTRYVDRVVAPATVLTSTLCPALRVRRNVEGVQHVGSGALADVLGATGPVKLPSGQHLTSDGAVQLLLLCRSEIVPTTVGVDRGFPCASWLLVYGDCGWPAYLQRFEVRE